MLRIWQCHALRSLVQWTTRQATRPDHPIDDLRTRFLVTTRAAAWHCVREFAENLPAPWRIDEEEDRTGGSLFLVRRSFAWFTSRLEVSLWQADDRRVAVDVVSSTREGLIDFGRNARNIRDFYRALEAHLQHGAPTPRDRRRNKLHSSQAQAVTTPAAVPADSSGGTSNVV